MSFFNLTSACILAVACASPLQARDPALEWFEQSGLPISDRFVRDVDGEILMVLDSTRQTAVYLDLDGTTFPIGKAKAVKLEDACRQVLARSAAVQVRIDPNDEAASLRMATFVLAAVAERKGELELSAQLLAESRRLCKGGLKERLIEDFAESAVRRMVYGFNAGALPLPAFAKQLDRLRRIHADSTYGPQFEELRRSALRMLKQSPLPKNASRVQQLIRGLRQQGPGLSLNGRVNIFSKYSGTSAAELQALGYDAVPELIEALKDRTLTKVYSQGRFDNAPRLWRVGECAQSILENIRGERFEAKSFKGKLGKEATWYTNDVFEEATKWWATAKQNPARKIDGAAEKGKV